MRLARFHQTYNGNVLSGADIPATEKEEVIDYTDLHFKKFHTNNNQIPVKYDVGGGHWDWLEKFGLDYPKIYPGVYSLGRVYDYLLLRRHGLHNLEEGIQLRSSNWNAYFNQDIFYLIEYSFQKEPKDFNGFIRETKVFKRLRLNIYRKRRFADNG
jgi:hypothetical protein